jgi:glyoxylase-like metal-dependent hydrolase (beta-lactamase superfamily II)
MSDRVVVGNVEITSLSDGLLTFDSREFYPSVSEEAWEPYRDQMTPEGLLTMNMGSFVLRSEGKTVLVDTGLGKSQPGSAVPGGLLLEDFAARSIPVEEIDMVVTTHLHGDHVGWNLTREGDTYRPTFPNARYWVPRADWDLFTRRAGMQVFSHILHQVVPLESLGILELMEGEQQLTSEISALPTPGHTPGHTSVLVSSQGESAIIFGDAAHIPAQVQETDWSPRPDTDPELSRVTRRNLMDRIERDGSLIVAGHFPAPGFGRIVRLKERRYWQAL